MRLSRTDLADFSYFLALAKHRNFRRAGLELGVSASALSHSLKGLESRLGVRLINRTSRSVTLTAAGEEVHGALAGPFDEIEGAAEALNRYRGAAMNIVSESSHGESKLIFHVKQWRANARARAWRLSERACGNR